MQEITMGEIGAKLIRNPSRCKFSRQQISLEAK
jgi:hypothetical protein